MSDDGYRVDVALGDDGDLIVGQGGDVAIVDGPMNAAQALRNRLRVQRGELALHPAYGSLIEQRLVGIKFDLDLTRAQVNQELRDLLAADPRFLAARNVTASRVSAQRTVTTHTTIGPGQVTMVDTIPPDAAVADGTVVLHVDPATGRTAWVEVFPGPGLLTGTAAPSGLNPGEAYYQTIGDTVVAVWVQPGGNLLTGTTPPSGPVVGPEVYYQLDSDGQVVAIWADPRAIAAQQTSVVSTIPNAVAVSAELTLGAGETLRVADLTTAPSLADLQVLPTTIDEVLAIAEVDPTGATADDELADELPDFEGEPDTDLALALE